LATQIGSQLVGVLYILDEPSIGLHQRDNGRLIHTLEKLRDVGNTVLVVEHDEQMMRAADWVVDLGPGAGEHGGEIVAEGTAETIESTPGSVTGRSLTLVIGIMCFLACLTSGAVWMIKESSDAWLNDIASEVTVQVTPQENGDIDKVVADVVAYLKKQRGVASVNALSLDQSAALLQPWLGSADALNSFRRAT